MKNIFALLIAVFLVVLASGSVNAATTYWAVGAQNGAVSEEVTITVLQLPNETPPDVSMKNSDIFFSSGPYKTLVDAKNVCEMHVQVFSTEMDVKIKNLCSQIRYK